MAKVFRVPCKECGAEAVIRSSSKVSDNVRQLYCECTDIVNCGKVQWWDLSFNSFPRQQRQPLKDFITAEQMEIFQQ